MKTALLLGATGFIGGHIGLAARRRGWIVRGLRRNAEAVGLLGDQSVAWFTGDLDQPGSFDDALRGVDVVFHAGAYYAKDGRRVPRQVAHAVRQTRNVLEAVQRAGSPLLVFTSSLSTIGRPPKGEVRPADERDFYAPGTLPRSAYYECKIAMEAEVLRAAAGQPVIVVNPTAVLGPGDLRPTIGGVLIALAKGYGVLSLPGWLNIVDVRDVAEGHLLAVDAGRRGERTILGGANVTIREFMGAVARLAGVRPPRAQVPIGLLRALVRIAERLPGASVAGNHLGAFEYWVPLSSERAGRELGFSPRPLGETLTDALRWYEDHGVLRRRTAVV